ncbi:LptF/LptG family permease [Changchengzhania lutea]|uniref:LptF/LptG family permease n=1 Tax=Changchengzhania lutea TaxID=2049305 RepID=UPI001FE29097|nr:LptF/LptG family permease [Changchengzhania lutea]
MIFVLQTIWLYIKELAGKDLDIVVIFKFLVYFMPKLMPLVLPLTILLSSIMVFGSFAENYEFAAMKSTGISLQRAMTGLSVFIVLLGVLTFFFSNNVIPWAEYNSFNLRKNIAKLKPAMLLAEGQFNEVGNYNIKFADKSGDRGQFLRDVTIHIKGANGRTNATTIKSKTGELVSKENSNVLQLILFDGNYYNDILPKKMKERKKKPFAKSAFEKYTMNIDLSELNEVDFDEKSYTDKYNMLNISGLGTAIDSLIKKRDSEHENFSKNLYQRSSFSRLITNKKTKSKIDDRTETETEKDSIIADNILDLFDTKKKIQIVDLAAKASNSTKQLIATKEANLQFSQSNFNKHIISFHEKLALGFACVILFFVGAPLGALIRKGGLGLPMVVAILLFLTYHFIGIFAINSAKSGDFNPILASWFSTLIMLPLGIFLTKRATEDRGLFEFGNVLDPLRKAFNIKPKDAISYTFLEAYTVDELKDVIVKYKTLGLDEFSRYEALKLLHRRGISNDELRESGIPIQLTYDESDRIYNKFNAHSKYSLILYCIAIILLVLYFVFKNNRLPSIATASIQLCLVALVLLMIYYLKSIMNLYRFYKHIRKKNKRPNALLLVIGLPVYALTHFILKAKFEEDLKLNCINSLK